MRNTEKFHEQKFLILSYDYVINQINYVKHRFFSVHQISYEISEIHNRQIKSITDTFLRKWVESEIGEKDKVSINITSGNKCCLVSIPFSF